MTTLPKIAGAKKHRNANSIVPKDQQELMDKVYNGALEIIFKHKQAAAHEAALKKQTAVETAVVRKGPRIAGPVVSHTGVVNKMLGAPKVTKISLARKYMAEKGEEATVPDMAVAANIPLNLAKKWMKMINKEGRTT